MDVPAASCGSVAVGALNKRQAIGMSRHVSQHHGTALLFPQFQRPRSNDHINHPGYARDMVSVSL
jgi:hypothetical protein